MLEFDIIVIGAGIAGVSVAAHLAQHKRVCILEMEERPAYHATGRSAAMYEPNYGPRTILALTRASKAFFDNPPHGFADAPLITPRPSLFFMPEGQQQQAAELLEKSQALDEISEADATKLYPVLRQDYARRSFLDVHTADMDVDLIHRGFLKIFKAREGTLALTAAVNSLERKAGQWHVTTPQAHFSSPLLVNAAGAWGDVVATMAGVSPVGLSPKRRSIGVVPITGHPGAMLWPMVTDVGETWYSKPQSGMLMISSADATPVEPHDAWAYDMAVAEGIDRLMQATSLEIDRLEHSWGGLRTFAPDGNPVVGFDPQVQGFFWLAGQGGYGIQSCAALAETAAAMVLGRPLPTAVLDHGLNPHMLRPERNRQ
jgi:D-arginine dehydrogenase